MIENIEKIKEDFGMITIKGYCQKCENFDPFLKKINGKWLCTTCRDGERIDISLK